MSVLSNISLELKDRAFCMRQLYSVQSWGSHNHPNHSSFWTSIEGLGFRAKRCMDGSCSCRGKLGMLSWDVTMCEFLLCWFKFLIESLYFSEREFSFLSVSNCYTLLLCAFVNKQWKHHISDSSFYWRIPTNNRALMNFTAALWQYRYIIFS